MAKRTSTPPPGRQGRGIDPGLVALIGVIVTAIATIASSLITSSLTRESGESRGRATAVAELQATINFQETTTGRVQQNTNIVTVTQNVTVTQLAIVTPTPNIDAVSVETIPGELFSYNGEKDPEVGNGLGRLVIAYRPNRPLLYRFDYTIPEEGNAYAGFVFLFTDTFNFEDYDYIELTITYDDNSAKAQIGVKDITGSVQFIRLTDGFVGGSEITTTGNEKTQVIQIPVDINFNEVNKKLIKEISFSVNAAFTRGIHTFRIENIQLKRRT